MTIASVITAAGWTVEAVAGALGLSPTLFVRIDAGRQALPVDLAAAIARVIGVSVADVVTATGRTSGIASTHVPLAAKAAPVRPDLGEAIPTVRLAPVPGVVLPPRVEPVGGERFWLSSVVGANGTSGEAWIGCVDCAARSLVGVARTEDSSSVGALAWNGAGIVWGVDGSYGEGGGQIWKALTSDPGAAPAKVTDTAFGMSRAACNAGEAGMFKGNFVVAGEMPVAQVQAFDGVTGAPGPWVTLSGFGLVADVIAFDGLLYAFFRGRIHEIDPDTMTILRTSTGDLLKFSARLAVAFDPSSESMAIWLTQDEGLMRVPLSTFEASFVEAGMPTWGEGICADPDGALWFGVVDGEMPGVGKWNPTTGSFDGFTIDFGADQGLSMSGDALAVAFNDGAVWFAGMLSDFMAETMRVVAIRLDPATVTATDVVTVRGDVHGEQVTHATMEITA